jgi:excisionase family DNA binding protein
MSSGEIALLMGVSRPTVYEWLASKQIEGYELPSGHRRATRKAVIRFLKLKGYNPNDLSVPFLTEEEQIEFDRE